MAKTTKDNWCVYLIASALVLILVLGAVDLSYQTRCRDRVRAVKAHLEAVRASIREFFSVHERYPNSLDELRRFYVQHGKQFWDKMYVDLTSEKQTDVPEFRELNDRGGYFYDPNTGEIRLNLTRRVEEYFRFYRGRVGTQVPATW